MVLVLDRAPVSDSDCSTLQIYNSATACAHVKTGEKHSFSKLQLWHIHAEYTCRPSDLSRPVNLSGRQWMSGNDFKLFALVQAAVRVGSCLYAFLFMFHVRAVRHTNSANTVQLSCLLDVFMLPSGRSH